MRLYHHFLRSILLFACLGHFAHLQAQVSCVPAFPTATDNVTITFNAAEGNAALANFASPVYAHMGVITSNSVSPSDWKYVKTTWGTADALGAMTNAGANLWTKTFNIQSFFNVPANETILKLAFVFRNQAGSTVARAADGSDIFYEVYPANAPLIARFFQPVQSSFVANAGTNVFIRAAASKSGSLSLWDNGTQISTQTGTQIETTITTSAGFHQLEFIAVAGTERDTATFSYIVPGNPPAQNPPAGTEWGINYINDQSVRLALYAPEKNNVFVLGDFNNWQLNTNYQMRRSEDGKLWWLDIGGLTPGWQYGFQYLVDGVLKIADPLSTLVLDQGNDPFIPSQTFPNPPAYPTGQTSGTVSVLQTAQTPYNWQAGNYVRPKKSNLVIYEMHLRDFLAAHDFQTLLDTLDYLERLGVNTIELMPVSEFDGNISWGYNPAYHKALDKYYGSPEAFKDLVDACHARNMAVVLDVVFNQATGASPLAQLYWDGANNRPAANNPWLNPVATHPFNVFNDFNHESQATKTYTKNCLKYWIQEYRIDGFRFDLSKGFTQVNSGSNVGQWGNYDASRVAIWKDYADFIWGIDPANYVILEHFANNDEEKELAQYGMMLWGNMWGAYKDVALGYSSGINADLRWIDYKQRGWSQPHVVGYMESHDEDRIGFECKTYGNSVDGYNVKDPATGMRRIEMLQQLFYTVPGPKMLWQFGELGYDFPINWCQNGTINSSCRTDPKPIRWDYFQDPNRRRLHDVIEALLQLRKQYDAFETTNYTLNLGAGQIRRVELIGTDLKVVAVANIGMTASDAAFAFPAAGNWYEYYSGDTLTLGSANASFSLDPGEYRLYLDKYVPLPAGSVLLNAREAAGVITQVELFPNPASEGFVLRSTLKAQTKLNISVYDALGRLHTQVLNEQEISAGEQQWWIETASWQPGIYFVVLRDANGAQLTRRFVKG